MKLRKTLSVNGTSVGLISDDIRLGLFSPGRAVFQVQASEALSGVVVYSIGYASQDEDHVVFAGYVERSMEVDRTQQRLACMELTGAMDAVLPISLRHPTLRDVAQAYAAETGLVFAIPDRPYATTRVSCFHGIGSGYHALDTIGDIFGISDYVWAQQGDGSVFIGSWQDSRWAARPLEIESKWFSEITAEGSAKLPVLPALRPGVMLNGDYVMKLQLAGQNMVVRCAKQLKKPF